MERREQAGAHSLPPPSRAQTLLVQGLQSPANRALEEGELHAHRPTQQGHYMVLSGTAGCYVVLEGAKEKGKLLGSQTVLLPRRGS